MTAATALTVAAVQEHGRALRLPPVAAQGERLAPDARRNQHSPLEYWASLLVAEVDDRARRALARRLQAAHLPRRKTLEDFDFSAASQISATRLQPLAEGRYLDRAEPIIFIGDSGTPTMVPWEVLIFGSLGIALSAGSAAAINQLVDRQIDSIMARTCKRPLPTGHLDARQVLPFAFLLGAAGMALLVVFANPLTAVLTFGSLIGYAVIYTMFLKRATPQNILIGGAAGAAPPLLGWTAVTGQVQPEALLLFLIIFAWTPPHFWALAIHRRYEYAKADIPMLPVTHGVEFTRLHILLYTIILFLVTLLPFLIGMCGWLYLVGAVTLGIWFLYYAVRLFAIGDDRLAMPTFGFSIIYLFSLFAVLMVDHYLLNIVKGLYRLVG